MKNKLVKASKKKPSEDIGTKVIVASLEKKAKPAINKLKKITKVRTQADMVLVGEQVKYLKVLRAESISEKKKMTDGINQSLNAIKAFFKPFEDKIDAVENDYKLMIADFLVKNKETIKQLEENFSGGDIKKHTEKVNKLQVSNTGAAKVRKVWTLFIDDAKKIPREFLVPDEHEIEQAMKKGKKVAGCRWEQVDNIAI